MIHPIKHALFAILLFASLISFSQTDELKADVSQHTDTQISLSIHDQKEKLLFRNIDVYDVRHDTSCLGINATAIAQRMNIIVAKNGLAKEARNYYLSLIDSTSGENKLQLHCFIKKLILSDHIYIDLNEELRSTSKKYDVAKVSGIIFIAEFYFMNEGHYTPLCRFDTTIFGTRPIAKDGRIYLEEALMASLKKAYLPNTENMRSGKRLTRGQIDDFNNERFKVPILNEAPTKGLYLTFKDFLANKPSAKEFTVEKNRTGDFLYVKNGKGEDILFTDLWGYSDGKDIFIYSANNYFKLFRVGNGFKVYGAKDFTGSRNLRLNFGLVDLINPNSNYSKGQTAKKYYLIKDYYQVDMETGELF